MTRYPFTKEGENSIGEGIIIARAMVDGPKLKTVKFEEDTVYYSEGDEVVDVVIFSCNSGLVTLKRI